MTRSTSSAALMILGGTVGPSKKHVLLRQRFVSALWWKMLEDPALKYATPSLILSSNEHGALRRNDYADSPPSRLQRRAERHRSG